MAWYDVGDLDNLIAQSRMVVEVAGQKILVIWHNDLVHATQSQCPHLKLPLFKSEITQDDQIICPFHKSSFSLCDGEVKCWSPWPKMLSGLLGKVSKPKNLQIYPVRLDEKRIMVELEG